MYVYLCNNKSENKNYLIYSQNKNTAQEKASLIVGKRTPEGEPPECPIRDQDIECFKLEVEKDYQVIHQDKEVIKIKYKEKKICLHYKKGEEI